MHGSSVCVLCCSVPTVPVKNLNGSSPVHPALAGMTNTHLVITPPVFTTKSHRFVFVLTVVFFLCTQGSQESWWVLLLCLCVWLDLPNWFCILHLSARATSNQCQDSATVAGRQRRSRLAKVRPKLFRMSVSQVRHTTRGNVQNIYIYILPQSFKK